MMTFIQASAMAASVPGRSGSQMSPLPAAAGLRGSTMMLTGLRLSARVIGVWPISPWSLLVRFCEPHSTMQAGLL